MEFVSLTLPDDVALWPQWLEQRLVGDDLRAFVREHEAITGRDSERRPLLSEVLWGSQAAVRERGLAVLTAEQLRNFFEHPRLLYELQEDVLAHGGPYWDRVPRPASLNSSIEQQLNQMLDRISPAAAQPAQEPLGKPASLAQRSAAAPRSSRRTGFLALAAVLAITLTAWLVRPAKSPWAFEDPGRFAVAAQSSREYLELLEKAAGDFRPAQIASRELLILETRRFIASCDQLRDAPHPRLEASDSEWLKTSCGKWSSRMQEQLAALENPAAAFEDTRTNLQGIVDDLIGKLKTRAEEVST